MNFYAIGFSDFAFQFIGIILNFGMPLLWFTDSFCDSFQAVHAVIVPFCDHRSAFFSWRTCRDIFLAAFVAISIIIKVFAMEQLTKEIALNEGDYTPWAP